MGRVIFYEDRNFQGRSYECSSDCVDLTSHLSRCYSCRVDSGYFMVYDRSNYMGNQYFLRRGEYPDCTRIMGFSDFIRSCRLIPVHRGPFRMKIYELENFGGQMVELVDDCDSIMERHRMPDWQSCHVTDGPWLLFEQPHFRGRMVYVKPGEYQTYRDMGLGPLRFTSARRITDTC